jgi:hypothetical protein
LVPPLTRSNHLTFGLRAAIERDAVEGWTNKRGAAHYFSQLSACNVVVDLIPDAAKAQLPDAMKGHFLAEGQLAGNHGRYAQGQQVSRLTIGGRGLAASKFTGTNPKGLRCTT